MFQNNSAPSLKRELEGARVVITGGAGFIGSLIADKLLQANVGQIVLIDNMVRGLRANVQNALSYEKVKLIEGSIADERLVESLFPGMDYCFHMAALRITHCAENPRECFETMYTGTFNVLESCVVHKIKKIVAASSASIYGMADVFPTSEEHHPYNNRNLYGAAKIANESMMRAFHEMFNLEYLALRFFNVYGPRMDTHGKYTEVLIRWYRMIRQGKRPIIFGDGKQTMDFVYVEDVAQACLLGIQSTMTDEVFNVACGKEISLEELCFTLLEVMNSDITPEYVRVPGERKKVEVARRLADISKISSLLGFKPGVSLRQGLSKLVKWLNKQGIVEG
jgi:UDP-glucose 4-epimerase